jgi:hypothetical protein
VGDTEGERRAVDRLSQVGWMELGLESLSIVRGRRSLRLRGRAGLVFLGRVLDHRVAGRKRKVYFGSLLGRYFAARSV